MQTEDFQAIVRRYAVRRQAAVDEKSQEELANLLYALSLFFLCLCIS
jgi:hypothetical protein